MFPKSKTFGKAHLPTVWLVDDIWFEGGSEVVPGGSAPIRDLITRFDRLESLEELLAALEESGKKHRSNLGVLYLQTIASLCREYRFRLVMCNFDYLEKEFNTANNEQTAVLVDVEYYSAPEHSTRTWSSATYGIDLVAANLQGKRPRADLFFYTAYPARVTEAINSHRGDPSWWPLRYIPCVAKVDAHLHRTSLSPGESIVDSMKEELKGFIQYFKQKLPENPESDFAHALLEANEGNFAHPDEKFTTVPPDFFLRNVFADPTKGVGFYKAESFKALHDYDPRVPRALDVGVLVDYLRYANVGVNVVGQGPIRLPYAPGMIFMIWLVALLKTLEQDQVRLEIDGEKSKALVMIPLRDSPEFRKKFYSGGGTSVAYLRNLLLGEKVDVSRFFDNNDMKERWTKVTEAWAKPGRVKIDPVLRLVEECRFTDAGMVLSWTFDPPAKF